MKVEVVYSLGSVAVQLTSMTTPQTLAFLFHRLEDLSLRLFQ